MTPALVRDMRELRGPSSARASAGLSDSTIRNDTGHLDLIRNWFGRPLWEMKPEDADVCFGRVLRAAKLVDAHRAGGRADGVFPVPGASLHFVKLSLPAWSRDGRELMVTLRRARLACRGRWARCGPAAGSGPVSG